MPRATQRHLLARAAASVSIAALAFAPGCATAGAAAAKTTAAQWYEVRSPHFQLWTDGNPHEVRGLALDLERFHEVMLSKTRAEERSAAPPLRIFVAKDEASFRALTGLRFSGVFSATYQGNYALITSQPRAAAGQDTKPEQASPGEAGLEPDSRDVLFHEYAHYVWASGGARVPSWYIEGFAEYMATTRFLADGSYTLGCPPRHRTRWVEHLDWLPIGRVMEAESVTRLGARRTLGQGSSKQLVMTSDSYAESWYAVHYFSADPARQAQLGAYLTAWADGATGEQAVQKAFGMSYAELDATLRAYAKRSDFPCVAIEPTSPLPSPAIDVKPLASAEAHHHVGALLLAMFGPTEAASNVLQRAAELDPNAPRTLAALARAHWRRAEQSAGEAALTALQQAEQYLERARRLGSQDSEVSTLEGHVRRLRATHWKASGNAAAGEELLRARKAYRKAIRADETIAEAYYGLGASYLIEDNGSQEPVVVLEAAAYLLPLEPGVAWALAQLHIARGNPVQAGPALEHILRWSKNEEQLAKAHAAIDELRSAAGGGQAAGRPPTPPSADAGERE